MISIHLVLELSNSSGLVETEFSDVRFKGDKKRASAVYEGMEALTAKEVASSILYMANVPEKVTIADMIIFQPAKPILILIIVKIL